MKVGISVVLAISVNTYKEAVRNKILYSLIFFALVMMGVSLVLDQATIGQRNKIIKDLGLASINIFGVLIAIVVGINLVYKEIEKRTLYPLLAKPVKRAQFLLGKYLGIAATLGVETCLMSVFLFTLIWLYQGVIDLYLFLAIFMIFIELLVVSAVALFFSSFSSPFLSGMFAFAVYVIGHLTGYLKQFGLESGNAAMENLTNFFYYFLPNLERLNMKEVAVYHLPIESIQILLGVLYACLYIAIVMLLATVCFEKRDFK
ncbi:MAG: ABC transporter permease [Nitrospiria bacterium]